MIIFILVSDEWRTFTVDDRIGIKVAVNLGNPFVFAGYEIAGVTFTSNIEAAKLFNVVLLTKLH